MDPLVSTDWLADRLDCDGVAIIDATWFMPGTPRDARAEYARSISKVKTERPEDASNATTVDLYGAGYDAPAEKGFLYWLKSGFAFTLPLLLFGVLALVLLFLHFTTL